MARLQKRPSMSLVSVVSAVLPAFLSGCFAASISTHVSEPVKPTSSANVAVLAVMPGVVEPGSEWLRPRAMEGLVRGLSQRFPGVVVVDPATVADRLTARAVAADYASLLADFERAGVVDPDRVNEILDVIEATHFLHVRTEYAAQGLERAATNVDGSPLFYSTKHQAVSVVARLWEASRSGPTWEAVIRTESERGPFTRHRDPSELVESLVTSVVERVPLAGAATVGVQSGN